MYIFDGVNKKIIIESNKNELDVLDVYSRWKDWIITYDNVKFLPAFESDTKLDISNSYINILYLINDWQIIFVNYQLKDVIILNGFIFNK